MVLDLKVAYEQATTYVKNRIDISVKMLNKLSSLVLRNKNVSETKEITKLAELCESINHRRKTLSKASIIECYKLSFDAHFHLATLHPWADGNGRMSRLLMNQLQFEYGIIPSNINKDRKAEYMDVLIATLENDDIELFRNFMFDEHIRNLEQIIHNYQTSMEYNVIQIM